mgnify:CR=1 FL=1
MNQIEKCNKFAENCLSSIVTVHGIIIIHLNLKTMRMILGGLV